MSNKNISFYATIFDRITILHLLVLIEAKNISFLRFDSSNLNLIYKFNKLKFIIIKLETVAKNNE